MVKRTTVGLFQVASGRRYAELYRQLLDTIRCEALVYDVTIEIEHKCCLSLVT